jgi:VWFA-related protein
MKRRDFMLTAAGLTAAHAQNPAPEEPRIIVDVQEVNVPVIVQDKDGVYMSGLEVQDFRLFDNEKQQTIKLDVSFVPISMVVCVQANADVEPVLGSIKKIGPLLEGLVLGTQGEAAIVAFDHRIRVLQDFAADGKLFTRALDSINPGSSTSAMVDTYFEAVRMLRRRPTSHKRVILMISETQDRGSEGRLREALLEAQYHNVQVHTVNINRLITKLAKKMPPPRADHLPPGARPVPPGAPMTPGTTEALTGYRGATNNWVPVFVEIFTQVKSLFISNPAEVMTRYTGGREHSFLSQRDLEKVIQDIGEELHSQYTLTYNPTAETRQDGGWHDIRVQVTRYGVKVRHKDGYWAAARFR